MCRNCSERLSLAIHLDYLNFSRRFRGVNAVLRLKRNEQLQERCEDYSCRDKSQEAGSPAFIKMLRVLSSEEAQDLQADIRQVLRSRGTFSQVKFQVSPVKCLPMI